MGVPEGRGGEGRRAGERHHQRVQSDLGSSHHYHQSLIPNSVGSPSFLCKHIDLAIT